jgi:cytochrome b561
MSKLRSLADEARPADAPEAAHYDRTSIAFHWASAGLIGLNWLLGQTRSFFPAGDPRVAVLSTHMLIGLSIAAMLLARLAWRAGPGRRLAAVPGLLGLAARAMHVTLYLMIGATVLAGASAGLSHGFHLYGASLLPRLRLWPLPLLGHLHGKLADLLVLLAGLHALAALGHHVVLGDGVLLRMAPFLPEALRPTLFRPAQLRAGGRQPPPGDG